MQLRGGVPSFILPLIEILKFDWLRQILRLLPSPHKVPLIIHTPIFSHIKYYASGQIYYASLSNIKTEASEIVMTSAMFVAILLATQCRTKASATTAQGFIN